VTLPAQSDMLEIETSKLALAKADNDKTKRFADKLIKDHTETSTELKALVDAERSRLPSPLASIALTRRSSTSLPS